MTGWLASVADVAEARQVLAARPNVIDCKNPRSGALGALSEITVGAVLAEVRGRVPVSATVGDFPDMAPAVVTRAVAAMAATGVDYVKIGLFPGPQLDACLGALAPLARRYALVAVLFADRQPDFGLLAHLARTGFRGVMLDTAGKAGGGLLAHQPLAVLRGFVRLAKRECLLTGLAGSLSLADIERLLPLGADYLGFRSALCPANCRTAGIHAPAVAAVAARMAVARAVPPAIGSMPEDAARREGCDGLGRESR